MGSREIRSARKAHSRNALNQALPMSAALEALGSHLRDARRNTKPETPAKRAARGTTSKGK